MPAFLITGKNILDKDCRAIVFEKSLEAAKKNLKAEAYDEWLLMRFYSRVKASPQYDSFEKDGAVPTTLLLLDGWTFDCLCCGCLIDGSLMAPDNSRKLEPVELSYGLLCSPGCLERQRQAFADLEASRKNPQTVIDFVNSVNKDLENLIAQGLGFRD